LHGPTAKPPLIRPENEHDLAVDKLAMQNRRTLPSRQRTYIRLRARVDHLEDAISHFYNCHKRIAQARFGAGEEVKAFSQKKMTRLIE
jgi:hypothetical protein